MTIAETGQGGESRLKKPGESIFMLAYRCWHAGFDYGDAECWQYAWTALSNALGTREARPLLGATEDFVRILRAVLSAASTTSRRRAAACRTANAKCSSCLPPCRRSHPVSTA